MGTGYYLEAVVDPFVTETASLSCPGWGKCLLQWQSLNMSGQEDGLFLRDVAMTSTNCRKGHFFSRFSVTINVKCPVF